MLSQAGPDVRLINLETSITDSDTAAEGKDIHYRMHPANVGCLAMARPDAGTVANNHVLDFGDRGLVDTLDALAAAGIAAVGAGRDLRQTRRPAVVVVRGVGRVIVFAAGTGSSGIPAGWAATTPARRRLPHPLGTGGVAHRLIDQGVDVVHGHSVPPPPADRGLPGHAGCVYIGRPHGTPTSCARCSGRSASRSGPGRIRRRQHTGTRPPDKIDGHHFNPDRSMATMCFNARLRTPIPG